MTLKGQRLEIFDSYLFLLKTLQLGHFLTGLNGFANFFDSAKKIACKAQSLRVCVVKDYAFVTSKFCKTTRFENEAQIEYLTFKKWVENLVTLSLQDVSQVLKLSYGFTLYWTEKYRYIGSLCFYNASKREGKHYYF